MTKIDGVLLTEAEVQLIKWLQDEMYVDTLLDINTGIENKARELAKLAQGSLKQFPNEAERLAIRSAKMHQFVERLREVSMVNIAQKQQKK
ncbi:hypothetical protein PP175_00315 [Aneurinibacillus sp. Ricciae_BoGa-3]|uniref:hypothetical protein n=1 Tax=Aneurinibacillus sp. Ricciae_BoGa-3 TaxID=3022697 RepID=UPI002341BCB9|nr:hypothetical protein [Aneurinibacillus sp. Ricciae_BoGa-3]WCK54563.1 hypothetical protein PP175_00315 [Aneurinibacillus sp. Ricciae_BoGa-3]